MNELVVIKFSELKDINYDNIRNSVYEKRCSNLNCNLGDEDSGILESKLISQILKKTPYCVVKQFYIDHGSKSEFQDLYSNIDIMNWSGVCMT